MAALSEELKPAAKEPEDSGEKDAGRAEAPETAGSESSEKSESAEDEESGEGEESEESGSSSEESEVSGGDAASSESTVSSGDAVSSGDTSSPGKVTIPGSVVYSETDNPELTELLESFQETQSLLLESSQRIELQLEAVISIFLIILVVGLLHYIYRFFKMFF